MINIGKLDNVDLVEFSSDTINALATEDLKEKIYEVLRDGTGKMVVDLKGVRYIDSSGFGLLLSITRVAKENYCKVRFCSIEPEVMKVLRMLFLHTVFTIDTNRDSSIAAFRA